MLQVLGLGLMERAPLYLPLYHGPNEPSVVSLSTGAEITTQIEPTPDRGNNEKEKTGGTNRPERNSDVLRSLLSACWPLRDVITDKLTEIIYQIAIRTLFRKLRCDAL
jgi:hypothetical protein